MFIFNIGNKILNIQIFRARGTFGTLSRVCGIPKQFGSRGKSYHKLKASLGYTAGPCLRKQNNCIIKIRPC